MIVSDFQEESREEFDSLMGLAQKIEASVDVLYVNTPYYFAETPEIHAKIPGTIPGIFVFGVSGHFRGVYCVSGFFTPFWPGPGRLSPDYSTG